MARMSVLTKSFRPDFELCVDLNRSVLDLSANDVHHHIIVPRSDLNLFRSLAGPRTHIHPVAEFLPRTFIRIPSIEYTINVARPFPPVRGWILQQVLKLSAMCASQDDVVVVADSDVEFVRPFNAETFIQNGVVRLYRKPDDINERLPRHVTWHKTARSLLGLPQARPPYHDYISGMVVCDPQLVRQMLARVAAVAGRSWIDVIAAQLHFSEWTLYGVYVDEMIGAPANSLASGDALCLMYYGNVPLDRSGAAELLSGLKSSDVAVMISAKSGTSLAVKREALAPYRRPARLGHSGIERSHRGEVPNKQRV